MKSIRMILGTLMMALIASTAFAQRGNFQDARTKASSISMDRGFVFIEDKYVSPPYEIVLNEEELTINGTCFTANSFDLSSYRASGKRRHAGMGGGRKADRSSRLAPNESSGRRESVDSETGSAASHFALRQLFQILYLLSDDVIIVLHSGAQPLVISDNDLGYELLVQLLAISENQTRTADVPYTIHDEVTQKTWRQLVGAFQPLPIFIERATRYVDEINQAQSRADAEVSSRQWSERLSYPLTMLALILVVAGLGHLMASAHEVFSVALDRQETAELSRNIILLLVIMALMSAIDLIWTVMAHHSGSMRELNPIGSMLIDDTTKLIVFKLVVTGLSIGLLFRLRRLPLTRKATWWCCLTMTLLTVRWLSFNSMLV